MKTYTDCIPCFIHQALMASRLATDNEIVHEHVLRSVLSEVSEMDMHQPPPVMGQYIHRMIRQLTCDEDPYRLIKDHYNQFALGILPELEKKVSESFRPFETATRLAIAGNIIDFGVNWNLNQSMILETIEAALKQAIYGDMKPLYEAVQSAENILYLGDNAGEIVFDRLLIEQLSEKSVIYAVRGGPVINDATINDAKEAGITDMVKVIDSGSDAPGTILSQCSADFMKCFDDADMIISKGQGNFETLSDNRKNIFFIFKAKCRVVAKEAGCEVGDIVLMRKTSNSISFNQNAQS